MIAKNHREYMLNIIEDCWKCKRVASFYFNKEDNCAHLTGFVLFYNAQEIVVAHITPRGEYDGYVYNKLEDLYRIEYHGNYEKKIERLYNLKKQTHKMLFYDGDNILSHLLDLARVSGRLVSLELRNDTITGYIMEYGDYVKVNLIDENGVADGECVINIDEVVTISIDTDYEQDLERLYRNR